MWLRYNFSKEKSLSHQSAIASPPVTTILLHHYTITPVHNPTLTTHYYTTIRLHHSRLTSHHSLLNHYTTTPLTTPVTSSLLAFHGRQVIFDRKLYREVVLSYELNPAFYIIYSLFSFLHRPKKKQKRLGLFLCL